MARQQDSPTAARERIRSQLENEKQRLYEAIRNYPRPVAGCDQQFNYLLEERSRIVQELNRLDEAPEKGREGLAEEPLNPLVAEEAQKDTAGDQ
jgi:hypothetical protein